MGQVLLHIVIGVAVTTIFHMFVYPFLPSHVRERMGYGIKFLRKYLSMSDIKLELVSKTKKTERFTDTLVPFEEFRAKAIQALQSNGYHVYDDGSSVKATIVIGNQSIMATIDFVSDVFDDDNLVFESMEIRVSSTCKLKNFSDCVSELYSARSELQAAVKKLELELIAEFCMVCEIKTMPNVKIMLDTLNYNTIHCETPAGQNFELQENKIIYYDRNIHRDMTSFIKKVIVTYS